MSKKLHDFIRHCPECQINQIPKYRPYGSFQPIFSPARFFHTLTIDYILTLPEFAENINCAMSMRNKFNKTVTYILGKMTWSTT